MQSISTFLATVFQNTLVRLAAGLLIAAGGFVVTAALGVLAHIPWFYRYLAGVGGVFAAVFIMAAGCEFQAPQKCLRLINV